MTETLHKPQRPPVRTVKLPHDRLRSLTARLDSLHRPAPRLPPPGNPVTVVCVSDTHGTQPPFPPDDVLLHAGDLTVWGSFNEIQEQLNWLNAQFHAHKIVVAGNHDLLFDLEFQHKYPDKWHKAINASAGINAADQAVIEDHLIQTAVNLVWGDVKYLQNESLKINVESGRTLRIYGSPNMPVHGLSAFQYPRDKTHRH